MSELVELYKQKYHQAKEEYLKIWRQKNRENNKNQVLSNKINFPSKTKEYRKEYYLRNRDKILKQSKKYHQGKNRKKYLEYLKKYHQSHKEESRKKDRINNITNINLPSSSREYHRQYKKSYYQKNRENILKQKKEKRENDLHFNLKSKMINRVWWALRSKNKNYNWDKRSFNIGYSIEELKNHLQKTMPEGYTWQDYLSGKLHIDHIIPINAFNFTSPKHIDFKKCWALNNLRLLPARENLTKSKKIDKPFQPSLAIKL